MPSKKSVETLKLEVVWIREEPGSVVHLAGFTPTADDVGTAICQRYFLFTDGSPSPNVSLPVNSSFFRAVKLKGMHAITCIGCNVGLNRLLAKGMVR